MPSERRLIGSLAALLLATAGWLPWTSTTAANDDASASPAGVARAEAIGEGMAEDAGAAKPEPRPWIAGLAEGRRRALADRKPILLRATADWCPPCRALTEEIGKAEVQSALAEWTLVDVDVDQAPDDARQLDVTAIPTLKILTAGGQPVAARVGFLQAAELIAWLGSHRQAAQAAPEDVLLAASKPTVMTVMKLAAMFGSRDPAVRQAAVGRLRPHADVAGVVTLRTLREGALAERLTALELLDAWEAPVEGLDPWKPDTINAERLARLEGWLDKVPSAAAAESAQPGAPAELSDEQRAAALLEIDRMLGAGDAEAAAMRDRLARFGPVLAEEVDRRLASAATDRHRERLRALRLRLATSDTLALRWPGGIERLAATETATRQRAAEQLAALATAADQALLLRLFADPDPLVREISLQGLQRIGGREAVAALAALLSDPEPNVRAAVLKLLEENPAPAMVPRVAAYLKTERDPDLIVHALRFLRASGGPAATVAMMELVEHPSWQVRAEAAAGLGNVETSFRRISSSHEAGGRGAELQAEAYAALIRLLDDPDAFVVGRAVEGLSGADMAIAVEPLVGAAAAHPELAGTIVAMLARGDQMRPKAMPHLRRFTRHEDALIRAAAVVGLVRAMPAAAENELSAALDDLDSGVRTAAAVALLSIFDQARRDAEQRIAERQQGIDYSGDPFFPQPAAPSLFGRLSSALGSVFSGRPLPLDVDVELLPDVHLIEPGPTHRPADDDLNEDEPDAEEPDDGASDEDATEDQGVTVADLRDPGPEWDRWLEGFYEGKGRPRFAAGLIEPLRTMLAADDARERLAAALALVPLGLADESLPVLLETARAEPAIRGDAIAVLPWLVWPRRHAAFEQLREMLEDDEPYQLVRSLMPVADRRAAELLWDLLGDERGEKLVSTVQHQLQQVYLGSRYYRSAQHMAPAARVETAGAAMSRLAAGSDWQRLVALALLLKVQPDQAAAMAEALAGDEAVGKPLSNAAFQVLLAAQPEAQRRVTAVAALGQQDVFRKRLAVAYLAEGHGQLTYFVLDGSAGWLELHVADDDEDGVFRSDGAVVPELPPELRPEHLYPLLEPGDPLLAAQAGYLLVMLGEAKGLDPLLRAWRAQAEGNAQFISRRHTGSPDRLVYRAIAALNDSSRIDVLRDIYATLSEYEIREFYWTIRTMSGPDILQLRKEIRDQVGMERLR